MWRFFLIFHPHCLNRGFYSIIIPQLIHDVWALASEPQSIHCSHSPNGYKISILISHRTGERLDIRCLRSFFCGDIQKCGTRLKLRINIYFDANTLLSFCDSMYVTTKSCYDVILNSFQGNFFKSFWISFIIWWCLNWVVNYAIMEVHRFFRYIKLYSSRFLFVCTKIWKWCVFIVIFLFLKLASFLICTSVNMLSLVIKM